MVIEPYDPGRSLRRGGAFALVPGAGPAAVPEDAGRVDVIPLGSGSGANPAAGTRGDPRRFGLPGEALLSPASASSTWTR